MCQSWAASKNDLHGEYDIACGRESSKLGYFGQKALELVVWHNQIFIPIFFLSFFWKTAVVVELYDF